MKFLTVPISVKRTNESAEVLERTIRVLWQAIYEVPEPRRELVASEREWSNVREMLYSIHKSILMGKEVDCLLFPKEQSDASN